MLCWLNFLGIPTFFSFFGWIFPKEASITTVHLESWPQVENLPLKELVVSPTHDSMLHYLGVVSMSIDNIVCKLLLCASMLKDWENPSK